MTLEEFVIECVQKSLSNKANGLRMLSARGDNEPVTVNIEVRNGEETVLAVLVWYSGEVEIGIPLSSGEIKDTLIDTTKLADMETELAAAIDQAVTECVSEQRP